MSSETISTYLHNQTSRFFKMLDKNKRFLIAIIVSIVFFEIFHLVYFKNNPLFGYYYLGEMFVGIAMYFFVYYFGGWFSKTISDGVDKVFTRTFDKALDNFGNMQTKRIMDAIKKEGGVKKTRPSHYKNVLLDTSAIIDGRIFAVIDTGFMDNKVVITQNVLDELKSMADKKDPLKRQKGRKGLDAIRNFQKKFGNDSLELINMKTKPDEVDRSLVELCKAKGYKLVTGDYNLNKAAQVAGVQVLNLNKLSNEIKVKVLPGDTLYIKLIQKGKEDGQALGYLDDGTMIIVNNAKEYVGKEKEVMVDKVLQTSAGQLIFANTVV
jgi:uncharacterized protein YacL